MKKNNIVNETETLQSVLKEAFTRMFEEQQDLKPEFSKVVDDHFLELT